MTRGARSSLVFTTMLQLPVVDYYALLDDPSDGMGGTARECREGNNEVLIWRPLCP